MEKAYIEVEEAVLGRTQKRKKPWTSEKSWSLEDQREDINKKILATRSESQEITTRSIQKECEVKRNIKADERKWMENAASKAEDERPRLQQERTKGKLYREGQGGEKEYKGR